MRRRGLFILGLVLAASLLACSQATLTRASQGARSAGAAAADPRQGARSLILMIGDGMGPEILSLGQVYSEKALAKHLNISALSTSGVMGMATTYSANRLVTDSAAGATALATGVKTNNGVVGQTPDGKTLVNLLEMAVQSGKSVGVITTTNVTDATPAAFLAHSSARSAEFDIAVQIMEGSATVVMGGGKAYFMADGGKRPDGRDLTVEAKQKGFDVVFDKDGLASASGRRLLGLFADEDIPFGAQRTAYETPTLSEMLRKALQMLTADPDGFVLIIEGGRIDHAEHERNLAEAMGEFLEFDGAVGEAMHYQESDSALTLVVAADHDTGAPALTSTEKGYPPVDRITELLQPGFPYLVWVSGNHAGTMVPVVARGPGQELFGGVRDNTDINRGMLAILGLGSQPGR